MPTIKFLKTFNKMSPRIKYIFVYRTIETWFYNADHLLYYPQVTVFFFDIFFLFSCISF